VRSAVTERVLREAKVNDKIKAVLSAIERPSGVALVKGVKGLFGRKPEQEWRDYVEAVAAAAAEEVER
jgi:hypothetical protein